MNTTHYQKVNAPERRAGPELMAKTAIKATRSVTRKSRANGAAAKRTRGEKVADKEEAIVAVAYEMIAAKGFARTTIAEIARKANVAEGTVYLYFENKEALASAVLSAFYKRLTAQAEAGVKKRDGVREKLIFLARHHLEGIIRESSILELITVTDRNSENYEGSALYQMNKDYVAVFDGVMREGVLTGVIAQEKASWITRDVFFGGLEYAMRTIMIRRRKKDVDAAVMGIVDMLIPPGAVQSGRTDLTALAGRLEAVASKLEGAAIPK